MRNHNDTPQTVNTYQLTWTIELDAASPAEAAAKALEIHRDRSATATVFTVRSPTGEQIEVDAAATDVKASPLQQLMVVGIYEDDHARFADTYEAKDSADAIRQAREDAAEGGSARLLIAAVLDGNPGVVDGGAYGEDDD